MPITLAEQKLLSIHAIIRNPQASDKPAEFIFFVPHALTVEGTF